MLHYEENLIFFSQKKSDTLLRYRIFNNIRRDMSQTCLYKKINYLFSFMNSSMNFTNASTDS